MQDTCKDPSEATGISMHAATYLATRPTQRTPGGVLDLAGLFRSLQDARMPPEATTEHIDGCKAFDQALVESGDADGLPNDHEHDPLYKWGRGIPLSSF